MKICPICKKESNTVGPKVLWDTKHNDGKTGSDKYLNIIMCDDCNLEYKNGKLRYNSGEI